MTSIVWCSSSLFDSFSSGLGEENTLELDLLPGQSGSPIAHYLGKFDIFNLAKKGTDKLEPQRLGLRSL